MRSFSFSYSESVSTGLKLTICITAQPKYKPTAGRFGCLDGSADIPWTSVNDDYCDCLDGSDEPGLCHVKQLYSLSIIVDAQDCFI